MYLSRYGSNVFVSRSDPLRDQEPLRGVVWKIKAEEIDLAFEMPLNPVDSPLDDLEKGTWRYGYLFPPDLHRN